MAETVQPMGPKLVSHGLLTIDTLNEKYGIWIPTTVPSEEHQILTTHGRASGNVVGQLRVVGEEVGN